MTNDPTTSIEHQNDIKNPIIAQNKKNKSFIVFDSKVPASVCIWDSTNNDFGNATHARLKATGLSNNVTLDLTVDGGSEYYKNKLQQYNNKNI